MEDKGSSIFQDICEIMAGSETPSLSLDRIVETVAERFRIDLCSVYLLDENRLVLKATIGLPTSSVNAVSMRVGEGLAGLAHERSSAVFASPPTAHPHFKHFDGSGEEKYATFLGVPLIYHRKRIGVLVMQTFDPNAVSENDIPVFTAIAGQISSVAAYSGLIENLGREPVKKGNESKPVDESAKKKSERKKNMLRGKSASAGFAEGHVFLLSETIGFDKIEFEPSDDPEKEIRRLNKAVEFSVKDIRSVIRKTKGMSSEDRAILETHVMLVGDPSFAGKIIAKIREGHRAEYALKLTVTEYLAFFKAMDDPYLKERGSDIEDAGRRILGNLFGLKCQKKWEFTRASIVMAADISPVELISLKQPNLKGVVLSGGGVASHAVIIAKSLEIPMIIGLEDAAGTLRQGDFVIIDGTSGLVFRKPPEDILNEYARLKVEKEWDSKRLEVLREKKAETADGFAVRLGANIGLLSDLELVEKYGADHVGLYRSEFPFLIRKKFPTEEELTELYSKIVSRAGGRSVAIRTLDIGGDKFLPYMDNTDEPNPYLGQRSIRLSLELEDVFRTQLRAILRASVLGHVKLLFPMITCVGELRKALHILAEEKKKLGCSETPFDNSLTTGIMVEVPAAIRILGHLLNYVDFISIGTNDLVQYTLAVDRTNEKVAHMFDPLHPAVISAIREAVEACLQRGKQASICGEAASDPLCAYLYLGMKAERLSMNPASIPHIKHMARQTDMTKAQRDLDRAMEMEDGFAIRRFLESRVPRFGT